MNYGKIMLVVTPIFVLLALFEKWYGWHRGRDTVRTMDMISSISSGLLNITKDFLGLTISIFSYGWMVSHLSVVTLRSTLLVYLIALIAIDFQMYWIHRAWHRINYLWNTHLIHHSSEEFNLACGLRQSISSIFNPFSPLLLPAALLGVPLEVIVIVAPFHLFAQFWYHTRQVGRLGFLEKIIVTPSHHRVHHAMNPQYIDRNYGSLLILWDKLFGTFQAELSEVPPVYGVTRPAGTWNPVRINFKHLRLIAQDAWHARRIWDKLRIWFMPTGWRPEDVKSRYPLVKVDDVYHFEKYSPKHHALLPAWSWFQLAMGLLFVGYLFAASERIGVLGIYFYGGFLLLTVFSYTELMDRRRSALVWEAAKNGLAIVWIYLHGDWFGISDYVPFGRYIIVGYLIMSTLVVAFFWWDLGRQGRSAPDKAATETP